MYKCHVYMTVLLYQYKNDLAIGTTPASESTQKTLSTATSDNDDTNEKPLARPVEEQSEWNT